MSMSAFFAFAQAPVKGKITDKKGEPMPGVSIVVQGTTIAAVTNENGEFEITPPATEAETGKKPKLLISFIGMKTIVVDADSDLSKLVIEEDSQQLNEVVVTALNIERDKKSLGYAIAEVSGSEMVGARETNIVQSLAAKVAGIQVIGSGGTPGASSKLLIRGNKSFTQSSDPLYVIDGVPMSNSTESTVANDYPFNENLQDVNYSNRAIDINPDDVEKITVLKGPSAAALYGVRAGNGVILITTKSGKKGQKPTFTYSTNVDLSNVNKLPELQTKYAQGNPSFDANGNYVGTFRTYAPGPNGIYEGGVGDDINGTQNSWGPTNASLNIAGKNNAKEFFKTGVSYTNNLSVSAGNEKTSYRASIGYTQNNGIISNTNFDRLTARINVKSELSKYFTLSSMANYINSGGSRAQQGSNLAGVMLGLLRAPSSYDLKGNQGEWGNGEQKTYFGAYDNPYWGQENNKFTDNVNRLIANSSLEFNPVSWLKFTYRAGIDTYSDRRNGHFAKGSNNSTVSKNGGEIYENSLNYLEYYQDIIGTATKKFNDFGVSVTLGNNINQRSSNNLYSRGRDLGVPKFYNLDNASDRYASQTNSRLRSAAFFYDVNLSYKEMLFIGATGRYEYSSTFGPNRRSFFFPSVNAAFVFTELAALDGIKDVLSFGKIRGSIAQSANTPPAYRSRTYFAQPFFTDGFTNGLSFPYNGVNGFGISNQLGNPKLSPEITTGYEIGLDAKLFKNRVSIDLTLYNQITSNILLNKPIAGSSGAVALFDNLGEMSNRGIELLVGATPIKTNSGFQWDISLNFTRNINEVTKLADGVEQLEIETGFGDPGVFAVKGKPYGGIFGSKWVRGTDGKLLIGDDGTPGITTTNEYLASYYPDWTAGLRNTFSYKGFSVGALLDVRQGGQMWNGTWARLNRIGQAAPTVDREKTYIIEGTLADGTPNNIAIDGVTYFQVYKGDFGATEAAMQDISWIRLRELSFSYSYNKPFLKYFKSVEFNITGRNLLLSTPYKGVDPEQSLTGAGSNYSGVDWFAMPNTRSWNFGAKFNF